jgi:hypothetical protein
MISIALKEANRVAKTSVDRRSHTLVQQRLKKFFKSSKSLINLAA